MILLLNYLPYFIIALGLYLCYRDTNKHKGTDKVGKRIVLWIVLTILALFALAALSNGYIGKAVGAKLDAPSTHDFVVASEEAEPVKDSLLKPKKSTEQSKKDFDTMVDWRADKAARETKDETELPLPPKQ